MSEQTPRGLLCALDHRRALAACHACALEIRAAAMETGSGLDEEDRRGLFALAALIERKAKARALARGIVAEAVEGVFEVLDEMIGILDALDAPMEDREPWLGAPENHPRATWMREIGVVFDPATDHRNWAAGANDDREEDAADEEEGGDDELSLGAPERHPGRCQGFHGRRTQRTHSHEHWACGAALDEAEDDDPAEMDDEPEADDHHGGDILDEGEASLSVPENHDDAPDQEQWAGTAEPGLGVDTEEDHDGPLIEQAFYSRERYAARETARRQAQAQLCEIRTPKNPTPKVSDLNACVPVRVW